MTSAAALIREARAAGVEFALVEGAVKLRGCPSPDLRESLRQHRAEILAVLAGNACRCCGEPLAWPGPVGVILGDGSAECHACADREVWRLLAAGERVVNSPDALADPAEMMLQTGGLAR